MTRRTLLALVALVALFASVQVSSVAARSVEYEAAEMAPPPPGLMTLEYVHPELRDPMQEQPSPQPEQPPVVTVESTSPRTMEASIAEEGDSMDVPSTSEEQKEVPRIHPIGPEQPTPRIHPIGPERPPRIHPIGPEQPPEQPTPRIHPVGPEKEPRIHPVGPEKPHEHTPTHPVGPEQPPRIHPIGPERPPSEHTPTHPVGPEVPPRIHPIGPERPAGESGEQQPQPAIHPVGPEQPASESSAGSPIIVMPDELQEARNSMMRSIGGLLAQLMGGAATPDLNDSPVAVVQLQSSSDSQEAQVEQSTVPLNGGVLTTSTRHFPGGVVVSREYRAGGPLISYPSPDDEAESESEQEDQPRIVEADVVQSAPESGEGQGSEGMDGPVAFPFPFPGFVRHFLRRHFFDDSSSDVPFPLPPRPFLHRGMFDQEDDETFPLRRQEHVRMSGEPSMEDAEGQAAEGEVAEGEQAPGMPSDSDSEPPRRHGHGRRGGCKRHGRHHRHGPHHHRLPLLARLRAIFDGAASGDVMPPPPPPPFFSFGPPPPPSFADEREEDDSESRMDQSVEWSGPGTPSMDVPDVVGDDEDGGVLVQMRADADVDVPMTLEEPPAVQLLPRDPSMLVAQAEAFESDEPAFRHYRHKRSGVARWVHHHRVALWAVGGALSLLLLGAFVFFMVRRARMAKEAASRGPMVLMAAPSAAFERVPASEGQAHAHGEVVDLSSSSVPYVPVPDEAQEPQSIVQVSTAPLLAQDA